MATIEHNFTLTLDYGVAHLAALLATKCDYIHECIKSHCPAWQRTGIIEVKVCLINMGRDYQGNEIDAAITELGLVKAPDNLALWTLGRDQPDLQREIGIMDHGSVWQDGRGYPCFAYLGGSSGYRLADLSSVQGRWLRYCRVLALSK